MKRGCLIDNCESPHYSRGWCRVHYYRWLNKTEMLKPIRKRNRLAEFHRLRSVDTDDCVVWPYGLDSWGYGRVRYLGRKWTTHRLALVLATGVNDPAMQAAHGPCHNPACMNTRHLRWATHAENQGDRLRDGTHNRGERAARARLTDDDVRFILTSSERVAVLADQFGVHRNQIYRIKDGSRWPHIWEEIHGRRTNCQPNS